MSRHFIVSALGLVAAALTGASLQAQTLAFPGAEGFGRFATGGRGGSVYHVTNLNDTGEGSFRYAVSKPNRIVVFDVAGVIRISSRVSVAANLYIAGQTAPGEGVTIYGNGISFSNANNTICRYLRVRQGAVGSSGTDAAGVSSGHDMIFDHCSFAWGRDEVFSISGSNPADITVQNCIIGQGLMGHSAGGLMQSDQNITIYRSLYIHNDTRNPKFKGRHQYVNNIVYNWKTAAYIMGGDSEGTSYSNAESNLFITGPTGRKNAFSGANSRYNIYADDNMVDDNQDGILNPRPITKDEFGGGPTFLEKPNDYPSLPKVKAAELFNEISDGVGASLPYRDPLDWMLVSDLKSFGKEGDIISNESTLDIGAPTDWGLWTGTDRTDTDGDGMPDWWEKENGTNPAVDDAMTLCDDGYVNIEHYINSITKSDSQYFLKTPVALKAKDAGQDNLTIGWRDFTDNELGYSVEQLIDDNWKEIARTGVDENTYTVGNLSPETSYTFRVRAFDADGYSCYSNMLTAKTKAKQAEAIDPYTYTPDFTWTGAVSDKWDLVTANWAEGIYADGKSVLFDAAADATVTIPTAVSPSAIMVKGNKNYTFDGVIAGEGSMNIAGEGTVKLSDDNTYSGGTVVWSGTLEIGKLSNAGQPSSIGTAQNWIWNGGKINYTGTSVATNREATLQRPTTLSIENQGATLTLSGAVSGDGDLVKAGAGTLSQAYGLHTYTGNTTVLEGTYELRGKDQIGNVMALNGSLILEGGRFRTTGGDNSAEGYLSGFLIEVRGEKESYMHIGPRTYVKNPVSGTGNLTLEVEYLREFYQGDWSNYFGTVTARQTGTQGNQFYLDNATYDGLPNAHLHLEGNLEMRAGSNSQTYKIGALSGTSSTTLACCFLKKDGGKVTWQVGSLGTDETFDGKITDGIEHKSRIGTTSLVKEGEGYWRLTGAQKYRGSTIIAEGTLIQNGTHSKDKDHTGTYFTPGAYTVADGATLAGKGSTVAPVVIKQGGMLSPGDHGIGNFTVNNDVTVEEGGILRIEIDADSKSADKLTVDGTIKFNGELQIDLVAGQYKIGDTYPVIKATAYSGAVAGIIPAIPGEGLKWDLSRLLTSGEIRVISESEAGIDSVTDNGPVTVESFTIDGLPATTDTKGIVIVRETYRDGTVKISKVQK